MRPLLFAMPENEQLAEKLVAALRCDPGLLEIRAFPDGETYLRFMTSPTKRQAALVCTLSQPNDKLLPLLFASATARQLGASKVGLVAPYLAYMRQDRRFLPGESVETLGLTGLTLSIGVIFAVVLLLAMPAVAQEKDSGFKLPVEEFVLDNGFRVLIVERHDVPRPRQVDAGADRRAAPDRHRPVRPPLRADRLRSRGCHPPAPPHGPRPGLPNRRARSPATSFQQAAARCDRS